MKREELPPSEDARAKAELDAATSNYIGEKKQKRLNFRAALFAVAMTAVIVGCIGGGIAISFIFSDVLPSINVMMTAFMLPVAIMVGGLPWIDRHFLFKRELSRKKFVGWCVFSIILGVGVLLGAIFAQIIVIVVCMGVAIVGFYVFMI